MLLFTLSLLLVLWLVLKPGLALFYRIQKKKHITARRERSHEMFAVNPHRGGSKRDRYMKARFLIRQNEEAFNEDVKFVFGTVFEIDNSNTHADTRRHIHVSRNDFEAAKKWLNRRQTRRLQIIRVRTVVNKVASVVIRAAKKIVRIVTRRVITYIHNTGGQNNHAPSKKK